MQQQIPQNLIIEIIQNFNMYLFGSILCALALKELAVAVLNWLRIKISKFGVGTKLMVDGNVWHVDQFEWTYVELTHSKKKRKLYVTNAEFLRMRKEILLNGEE